MDKLTLEESKPVRFREELPPEILTEIGKRLLRRLDIARFRSVCKTWRPLLPSPSPFPLRVPLPPSVYSGDRCLIHELSYYAVETESKADQANRMLVSREGIDLDGYKIMLCSFLPPLVEYSPKEKVKITQISSRDLLVCKFYALRRWTGQALDFYPKIVFISSNSTSLDPNYANKCDVTVVTRLHSGKLALLRLGECDGLHHDLLPLNWLLLNWKTDFCSFSFRDIIRYNGKLYTVETSGRAFAMDYHSLHMTQVAAPLFAISSQLMKLVESLGELYLLFVSILNPTELKVYKLRSELQQWHEVTDLGDQVFILCRADCFSVARDVFADSVLMDLKYETRSCVSSPCVVFSAQLPRSGGDGGGGSGARSRICVVPIQFKSNFKILM